MTRFLSCTISTLLTLCFDIQASLPEQCAPEENLVAFSSTTTLGFSAEQLLGNLTLSRSTCLTWDNDSIIRGSISFVPTSNLARITTYLENQYCIHPPESMSIDGILHIRSNDQTINAQWAARLSAIDSSTATIELEIRKVDEYQGFPLPQSWEIVPTTYLNLKFEGPHIDGILYRLSGTPVPCSTEAKQNWSCFQGASYHIAYIGRGVYTPFMPGRSMPMEAWECAEESIDNPDVQI